MTTKETIEIANEMIETVAKELAEAEEGMSQVPHLKTAAKMIKLALKGWNQ